MSADLLLDRVAAFLAAHALMRPEALLLVAVSGGPDSLCLLHLLDQLRARGGPRLHVAHLDHGVRGAQARAEAEAVAALAAAWGLPATIDRRDVPAMARAGRTGLQAAARGARYAFLAETARAVGATALATGHQADDQAETVLLHATRGAGLAGLRGMRPAVPWHEWAPDAGQAEPIAAPLIRPLLTTTRAEIAAYCAERGLAPFDDPSNAAPRYARARARRLLLALAEENPQVVAALGRTAALAADDDDYLQRQLDAIWPELASASQGAVVLGRAAWRDLHQSLQRYALRRAAAQLGQRELSFDQVEAARALAASPGRQMALGPRLRLVVDQEAVTLTSGAADPVVAELPQLAVDRLPLACPGATPLGGGWVCVVRDQAPAEPGPWWVALDTAALAGPLALRRRRPGDRFRPAGGRGSRRLQDFFVDRRVPRGLRGAWPILVAGEAIAWVAGLRADASIRPGAATRSTIWVGFVRARDQAMHHDMDRVLITSDEIQRRVGELGAQIAADYADKDDLLLVGVLKGCAMFMVDLARAVELPLAIDFIAVASYGASTESSGVVRMLKDLDTDIAGRHLLIVEDIIDSGLTLAYLRSQLLRRNPASLRICTLLNKPERRTADVPVDYLGFNIPNEFVVGYGLDYAERYRNLPYIGVLKPEIYTG